MVLVPTAIMAERPFINLMVYSNPGVGKTSLAATAQAHPLMQNVLFCNFEGGLLSVASIPGCQKVDVHNVEELEEVFWHLVNKDKGWDHYQTVVIDSGSEMQSLDLEHIAKAEYDKRLSKRAEL